MKEDMNEEREREIWTKRDRYEGRYEGREIDMKEKYEQER